MLPFALVACGLLLRIWVGHLTFLNPDEALHYALAAQPSLADAYHASLTTVHPPLYILVLHEWEWIGRSELVLRLLSVFSGVGFCWVTYLWVCTVQGQESALVCLALLLFLPSMVDLSAEVRQYSLLLLFASAALYFLDSAIQQNSWRVMLCSAAALWLALLTHYSAFIFALALGIYAMVRLWNSHASRSLLVNWGAGQLGALAIGAFLYISHISRIQSAGISQGIADTWLREWIFHPGQDHLLRFSFHNTSRLFRYLFSNGTVGVFGLALAVAGVIWLFKSRSAAEPGRPRRFELAILFAIPFAMILLASVAGKYPYGGTRHDALLALFAIPAASIGFAQIRVPKSVHASLLIIGLLVSNIFAVPAPPKMHLKDQRKMNMEHALKYLRSTAPPASIIFADHSAGLLLSYYLCHQTVVPFRPLAPEFLKSDCGGYELITPVRQPWGFQASALSHQLRDIEQTYGLSPGSRVSLFQAGWIDSRDPEWLATLKNSGCSTPKHFGQNILICELQTNQ